MITTHCTCTPDALDGEAPACEFCTRESALAAGIPASVYDGKTKLSDHFSPEYIKSRCSKREEEE